MDKHIYDALVVASDNFVTWIDSPDLEWGGVPETPELVALRAALDQVEGGDAREE